MEPCLSDIPREAAALIVAAARASGMVMWRFTQARCITIGWRGGRGEGGRERRGWGRREREERVGKEGRHEGEKEERERREGQMEEGGEELGNGRRGVSKDQSADKGTHLKHTAPQLLKGQG